ncbi:MAG: dihydrofolate reductase [Bacteroidales bacterium]|nr:dihydrofolate reductase [Bacteroidales bacterium]MBR2437887.1 dihydrofolate reductase [Bacteroidales bacterium]MBR4088014.1 dihydrofolate reductase [Bacteroidales bacterium]
MLSLIVAVAQNNAIGRNNELLWHISEDLKYFKSTTTGHPVIMGRKTYESIGRPLPGRRNIVLTRGTLEIPPVKNPQTTSMEVVNSLDEVYAIAQSDEEFFVMGGGMLYNETFGKADFLYLTKIYAIAEDADTFFPEVDEKEWDVVRESQLLHDEENDIDFKFIVYKRRR